MGITLVVTLAACSSEQIVAAPDAVPQCFWPNQVELCYKPRDTVQRQLPFELRAPTAGQDMSGTE